jgi:hypothetical protein
MSNVSPISVRCRTRTILRAEQAPFATMLINVPQQRLQLMEAAAGAVSREGKKCPAAKLGSNAQRRIDGTEEFGFENRPAAKDTVPCC